MGNHNLAARPGDGNANGRDVLDVVPPASQSIGPDTNG